MLFEGSSHAVREDLLDPLLILLDQFRQIVLFRLYALLFDSVELGCALRLSFSLGSG